MPRRKTETVDTFADKETEDNLKNGHHLKNGHIFTNVQDASKSSVLSSYFQGRQTPTGKYFWALTFGVLWYYFPQDYDTLFQYLALTIAVLLWVLLVHSMTEPSFVDVFENCLTNQSHNRKCLFLLTVSCLYDSVLGYFFRLLLVYMAFYGSYKFSRLVPDVMQL